ncbi:MAG TPA: DUF502 domain-containing protein [Coxiellaceae bacterium]|nr:DUF502 domain-containing protein [Coxiellaceae bacterium]
MSHLFIIIRRYFLAGLLFWIPLVITLFILHFLVSLLDGSIALLPYQYQPDQFLFGMHIPGLGIIFTLVLVLVTGLVITNILGQKLMRIWDRLLSRIPVVRTIYSAVKQVVDAVMSTQGTSFKKVLLVEFPRQGTWSLGFQTNDHLKMSGDQEMVVVFIPTTPNPTSGFLIFVPKNQVKEVNITIEQAFKLIVSLGVIKPEQFSNLP